MKFHNILLMSAAVLFCTASISAQLSHTWVSLSGSDSNPCTATSPCATFQYALSKTYADGIITAKDTGDFGPVNIAQSVTIDGANMGSITFNGVNNAFGIEITSGANVTLQNLTISGLGSGEYGIDIEDAGAVDVDHCKILDFTSVGIFLSGPGFLTVEDSHIESYSTKSDVYNIDLFANGAENVTVKNTVINASPYSNGSIGFLTVTNGGPVKASLQNVTITGAESAAVLNQGGLIEITGSVLAQNTNGVYATDGSTISVASSQINANNTGVCSNPSSKIRLDNNDIYDNLTAIANCGGIVKTSGTNKTSGTISIPAADVSESVTF